MTCTNRQFNILTSLALSTLFFQLACDIFIVFVFLISTETPTSKHYKSQPNPTQQMMLQQLYLEHGGW